MQNECRTSLVLRDALHEYSEARDTKLQSFTILLRKSLGEIRCISPSQRSNIPCTVSFVIINLGQLNFVGNVLWVNVLHEFIWEYCIDKLISNFKFQIVFLQLELFKIVSR